VRIELPTFEQMPCVIKLDDELNLVFEATSRDPEEATIEARLEATVMLPAAFAMGCGYTSAEAFLAMMAGEECTIGTGNLSADAVLILRDLAHEAVDVVCSRMSYQSLDCAVFADPAPASIPPPCGELPAPSEFASVALEAVQESLPEQFDALLLIVATPTSEEGLASVGVAVAEGLDKVFTAQMLAKLAAQYAEEAEVTL
jgi:hypothetical protein